MDTDFQSAQFMNFMNMLMAEQVGLDLRIKKGNTGSGG